MAEADTTQATTTPAVEDNSPTATPTVEPTTSEQVAEPVTTPASSTDSVSPAEVVAEPATQPERPSRAQSRIQDLNAKLKEVQAQQVYAPQLPQTPQAPKLSEMFAGQDSIDPAQLDQYGQQLYQQGAQSSGGMSSLEVQALRNELAQKEAINNYSRDETLLPTKFSELDPASPDYIPLADEKIAKAYQERAVKQNNGQLWIDPSVKLADVAADYIDMVRAGAERGKASTSNNLQTLADNGAITPNTEANQPNKAFEDKSLAEMEAELRAKGHDLGK